VDYSDATAVMIDQEIKGLIEKGEDTARKILTDNMDRLHKLANLLLEKELVDSQEIDMSIGSVADDTEPVETPAQETRQ